MADFLASDVLTKEEEPTVVAIPVLPTSVTGMVGITERGPVDKEVVCFGPSMDDFTRAFGGVIADSDLWFAVKGFFENGGSEVHIVRTVHHTDASDPTTKTSAAGQLTLQSATVATHGVTIASNAAPWLLHTGETLSVVVDGGSAEVATFTGIAAQLDSTTGTFALSDGQTLLVGLDRVNGGAAQTVTFHSSEFVAIGAATAAEVCASINAQLVGGQAVVSSNKVRVKSDTPGSASSVHVTGGTANGALGFSTTIATGSGNVADLTAVSSAEAIAIIGAAASDTTVTYSGNRLRIAVTATGSAHSVQVGVGSTAGAEFGFDNAIHAGSSAGVADAWLVEGKSDGSYAGAITVIAGNPTDGVSGHFNLAVLSGGVVKKVWPNLATLSTEPTYAPTVLNDPNSGDLLIKITDLNAVGNKVPTAGTFGPLVGGDDGLAGLADADFIGGTGPEGDVGMRALDSVQTMSLLAIPGRSTASVHNAMVTYCEITREGKVFAVLDSPAAMSETDIVDYVANTAALEELTDRAALYWPRVLVDNPSKAVFGTSTLLVAPPSGHICGRYARTANAKAWGVFDAPAGTTNGALLGVRGVENVRVLKKPVRELVFPRLINPISKEPGTPWFLDGARTLKTTGNFPTIGERLGMIFVETSLRQGLTFVRHRNIKPRLLGEASRSVDAFLLQGARNDAFASQKPSEAFFVDFGKGLNTPSTAFNRQVWGRIGVATAKPGEFVILLFSQDTRALNAELAALATT